MGELPIPARLHFNDFASSVLTYSVFDGSAIVGSYKGLSNSNEDGHYISFLVEENPQIVVGSVIATVDGLEKYQVRRIEYDRYMGKAELLNAYV